MRTIKKHSRTRSNANRQKARDLALEELYLWYYLVSGAEEGSVITPELCDYKDAFGITKWWLEPQIRGRANLVVIEQEIGDNAWQIKTELVEPKIISIGGI